MRRLQRVLLLSPIGELGGAERVLLDFIASTRAVMPDLAFRLVAFADGPLLAAVEQLGGTVSVLALPAQLHSLGDSALLTGKRWVRGARLVGSLARSVPSLLTFVLALRKEIIGAAPDIVHSNGVKAHFLGGLATPPGIPLVWHIHDFLGSRPFAGWMLRLISRKARAAIAISNAILQDTHRVLPSLRVIRILNAVDVDEFSPGPGDGERLDALAAMTPAAKGTVRVGLVSTYARWKGQENFIRAAARLRASLPAIPLRFYVVGGPLYATSSSQFSAEELRALITEHALGDIAGLVPFQANLPPILRSLDVVVHASTRPEPFGRTVIEAMACGRAVVVAGTGGVREVFRPGVTGISARPDDPEALAAAIERLVCSSELRSRLGHAAADHARTAFTRVRLGPALLDVYQSLLVAT